MSHTWSGFGLLLIATILHTTALTMRIERIKGKTSRRAILQELYLIGSECCLSWIAVVSALRVVISPRNSIPACHPSESLASTFFLVVWAVHFIVLGNVSSRKDRGLDIEYPARYIEAYCYFFLVLQ